MYLVDNKLAKSSSPIAIQVARLSGEIGEALL